MNANNLILGNDAMSKSNYQCIYENKCDINKNYTEINNSTSFHTENNLFKNIRQFNNNISRNIMNNLNNTTINNNTVPTLRTTPTTTNTTPTTTLPPTTTIPTVSCPLNKFPISRNNKDTTFVPMTLNDKGHVTSMHINKNHPCRSQIATNCNPNVSYNINLNIPMNNELPFLEGIIARLTNTNKNPYNKISNELKLRDDLKWNFGYGPPNLTMAKITCNNDMNT